MLLQSTQIHTQIFDMQRKNQYKQTSVNNKRSRMGDEDDSSSDWNITSIKHHQHKHTPSSQQNLSR